ncbi:putative apoptosis inducing factor [Cavenderia fasciculata]|uniref:Apoptosis inducing factor n=1 Tax=Cavenderia fasciculata TaxID=261658 RepID=F4PTY8_CACFS|nr:putative apoptosis inducing factor [Cavenderia fasciculata]EGG21756.1 putative apoptosis inducing factor [Cavenderia fasciculata]|eukprot:XP_004359606.1 putative apoptosis inducing factor [Cavenderia fasciculata]
MSSSSTSTLGEKKKVVIIGGGYGGVTLAAELDAKFDVTLVEKRPFFFHNVAALRSAVEPELLKKVFLSYDSLLKKGRVIYQTATEIGPNRIALGNGEEIVGFHYLVIATGTNNMTPFKSPLELASVTPYYTSLKENIGRATKVLIVGGGAVGVELAGEIATDFKGKSITIVHNQERLVHPNVGDKFNKQLGQKLKKMGITTMLSTSIAIPDTVIAARNNQETYPYNVELKTYDTDKGPVEADLVFWSIGNKTNNEYLQTHFATQLDQAGRIKVNGSLQVEGHDNVFAIGDITNVDELKTSYNAAYHAAVVSKNIQALESKKKLSVHKPSGVMISVSLGRKDGITQLPNGMILGGFMTAAVKSKGLFISRFKKALNNPKELTF